MSSFMGAFSLEDQWIAERKVQSQACFIYLCRVGKNLWYYYSGGL